MPQTNAFTAELNTSGQCGVKLVTIQGDFKLDTCRFHFPENQIIFFWLLLLICFPDGRGQLAFLMNRLSNIGKNNQHSLDTSITSIPIPNQGPMDSNLP